VLLSHHRGPGFPTLRHLTHVPEADRREAYGTGSFEVEGPLSAGAFTTVTFTFEIGATGVAEGGGLGVCWRWPFDWRDLQAEDPGGDGYVRVLIDASGAGVELEPTYERMGGVEPWHHIVTARLRQGTLAAGDRIRLVCGDRTGGGRGWRAPSCASPAMGFVMMVDPDGVLEDGGVRWFRLPDPPEFPVTAGPLQRLVAVAPSRAEVEGAASVLLRGEDRWGNPAEVPAASGAAALRVEARDVDGGEFRAFGDVAVERVSSSALRIPIHFDRPGAFDVRVELPGAVPGSPLVAWSNPVIVDEHASGHRLYWGDLHAGQSVVGCGMGSVAEHYTYARETAGVHFATEQSNDHYVTRAAWEHLRREAEAHDEPGAFVTFLGCEWSPETPEGGDRNVFYRHDEPRLRRSGRYFTEADPDPEPDVPTAPEFHRAFADLDVLVNIHVGGRMTNLAWHDGRIERLAEIHSTHGTIEWFIEDVLRRGYRVGITAGTDGVMGRPGADHPGHGLIRNVPNGLTGVYASDLTREGLWQAFRARRCYATTGERILLAVDVDGHAMGSEYETSGHPTVALQVTGTAPLQEVDVFRGDTRIHHWQAPRTPLSASDELSLQLLWRGTGARGSAQAQRLTWDGSLSVEGATILEARPIGYYPPDGGLRLDDAGALSWTSVTAGNEAGAFIRIRGGAEAIGRFSSGPCDFTFRLAQVTTSPLVVDAGGINRRVSVAPAPSEAAPRRLTQSFTDSQPRVGTFPYWVRVTQCDRAKAWSSPVYVTRVAPG
jgi:hypothetical protein